MLAQNKRINNRVKKLLSLAILALGLVSCSEDTIVNNYYVEFENVTLNAQNLITETESPFQAKGVAYDSTYVHVVPTSFQAYVVAQETRGQFVTGQVVKEITVVKGQNTVSLPKMKLKIYVTNYLKPNGNETQPNAWYTWGDSFEQMPKTSEELFYLGSVAQDFTSNYSATVTLINPYAGVMIKKNIWVNSAPSSYDTSKSYFLDTPSEWYVLYIRSNNTNTKIPINIPGNTNQNYTLSKAILPNKSYQYTINGNVLDNSGNLEIVVAPIEVGGAEQIDL